MESNNIIIIIIIMRKRQNVEILILLPFYDFPAAAAAAMAAASSENHFISEQIAGSVGKFSFSSFVLLWSNSIRISNIENALPCYSLANIAYPSPCGMCANFLQTMKNKMS